jgi:hypothetical protein
MELIGFCADLMHHIHPLFHQNDVTIDPKLHGQFSAENLRSIWKDLQAKYDMITVNFTKSGNHDSSFTRADMLALNKNNGEDSNESESSLNDDDVNIDNDDEVEMEGGGWCCFQSYIILCG